MLAFRDKAPVNSFHLPDLENHRHVGSDPGVPNWMDTAGHEHGTMCVRRVRTAEHPEPRCRVVELAALREEAG